MSRKNFYKITVEDETRLEKKFQANVSLVTTILFCCGFAIIFIVIGALVMAFTPVKKYLPGYLNEEERILAEESQLRIDSLYDSFLVSEAYINNLRGILSENGPSVQTEKYEGNTFSSLIYSDSLLQSSKEEQDFSSTMRERYRYNVSVIAPIAAESIIFSPVNEESVISEESKDDTKSKVILAKGADAGAIADGTVLLVNNSFDSDEKTSAIIQHPKGFLSRYSNLSSCFVKAGDRISVGQMVGSPAFDNKSGLRTVYIEMWHNGEPLLPSEYIVPNLKIAKTPVIDEDIGRGRL